MENNKIQYTYENINEHIQWIIDWLTQEYKNGFVLEITSSSAYLKYVSDKMIFLSRELNECMNQAKELAQNPEKSKELQMKAFNALFGTPEKPFKELEDK